MFGVVGMVLLSGTVVMVTLWQLEKEQRTDTIVLHRVEIVH